MVGDGLGPANFGEYRSHQLLLKRPSGSHFRVWAAFILTRPLGATVGDFLDKPLK
jgi:hypothetical protein